jgi:tetratricopeptide (TPR) repeat protein
MARRETVLVVSFALLFILFAITGLASRMYKSKQESLASEWFGGGERALEAGKAEQALEDFRTALAYQPDNTMFRLRLAQALVAAHRRDEARSHLLTLWRDEPGSGTVNLELARLAVEEGKTQEALRYFHNAIYGGWEQNPVAQRRDVRLELCEFLVRARALPQAQSELIALAAVLPRDSAWHARVAELFVKADDLPRALSEYRTALEIDGNNPQAALGAGEIACRMADYGQALAYLERAARLETAPREAKDLLETTRLIVNLDPYEPRLTGAEANRRILDDFETASARLKQCVESSGSSGQASQRLPGLSDLSERVRELHRQARPGVLDRNLQVRGELIELISEIEEQTARTCGAPSGPDLALLLITRKHGGSGP